MGEQSSIQWTENTWNPWHGCTKVSEGCKYCYMYRDKERYGQDPTTVMRSKSNFNAPLKWKEPTLIFTCSWSDWFIEDADEWRKEAWAIIKKTPQHTYQILTKRPERILQCLPDDWGEGYPNVWLGVSVENEKNVNRLWHLAHVPAKIRFVSAEPLLSHVYLGLDAAMQWNGTQSPDWNTRMKNLIHWVIIGGESGNETGKYKYRECHFSWIEFIIQQCKEASVPVFVKQLGTFLGKELGLKDHHGGDIDEWPEHLRIREFPMTHPV